MARKVRDYLDQTEYKFPKIYCSYLLWFDQIALTCWIIEKARQFQKNIYCFIDYAKAFDCVDHNKLWKVLKRIRIPDHLTCLLRKLYVDQEVTVHYVEQWSGSKLGKDYVEAVYCHPAYLTYMQCTSCKMLGCMNHRLESGLQGEISTNSDTQMIPLSWKKVKRNYRTPWWRWKRKVEKLA